MSAERIEILPFGGIPGLTVGMYRDQVEREFGPASCVRVSVHSDGSRDVLAEYSADLFELVYEEAARSRVARVTLSGSQYTLFGTPLVGLPRSEIESLFQVNSAGALELTYESEALDAFELTSEPLSMAFWFVGGALSHVTVMPQYDDEGEPVF